MKLQGRNEVQFNPFPLLLLKWSIMINIVLLCKCNYVLPLHIMYLYAIPRIIWYYCVIFIFPYVIHKYIIIQCAFTTQNCFSYYTNTDVYQDY